MLLRIVSDLHNDHAIALIPPLETDMDSILVLAGDICEFKKPSSFSTFFESVANRFKKILYVPGNHEYYGASLNTGIESFKKRLKLDIPELIILNNSTIYIDGIKFIGSTLWSDFDNDNPISKYNAESLMNDYRYIRYGSQVDPYKKKITANVILAEHMASRQFIENNIDENSVVITHHAPTRLSIPEKFKNDKCNGAYVSNLEHIIFKNQPKLWIHGHTHNSCEYKLDNTTVICNPRGYCSWYDTKEYERLKNLKQYTMSEYRMCFREQNYDYDPFLTVEV